MTPVFGYRVLSLAVLPQDFECLPCFDDHCGGDVNAGVAPKFHNDARDVVPVRSAVPDEYQPHGLARWWIIHPTLAKPAEMLRVLCRPSHRLNT